MHALGYLGLRESLEMSQLQDFSLLIIQTVKRGADCFAARQTISLCLPGNK